MNNFMDEVNKLVNDIMNHDVDLRQVQNRITELKNEYGQDSFPSINFQKKPQPWDEAYLKKLKSKYITGACSEEFLLYMAEVGDYIVRKKRRKLCTVIGIASVMTLIIVLIIIL